jgi:hypothetical protein
MYQWWLREFLRSYQLQLQMPGLWNFPQPQKDDAFLMDVFLRSGTFSSKDLVNLNAVRLYLQVATLSDISSAHGRSIDRHALGAEKHPYRKSILSCVWQPIITSEQRKLWIKALSSCFLRTREPGGQGRLTHPLGPWIGSSHQRWRYYYNQNTDKLEAPISAQQARAYARSNTVSRRHTMSFQRHLTVIPFHIADCVPADNVEWNPDTGIFTATLDNRKQLQGKEDIGLCRDIDCKSYIGALPKARQRFFAWCAP